MGLDFVVPCREAAYKMTVCSPKARNDDGNAVHECCEVKQRAGGEDGEREEIQIVGEGAGG